MSRTILARFLGMIGLAATMAGPLAWAQDAPLVRVRGTVERVDGPVYVVKARDGTEVRLTLATSRRSPPSSRRHFPTSNRARSWG